MKTVTTILTLAVVALVIAGCTSSTADKEKIYDVKGKVISVDADKKTVRLDHEDIPGFMKAMEMDFPVQDAKVLAGIKAGDQVHGKLNVKDGNYHFTELHKR